ncbi:hypothetical protein JKP88DRAFT_235919 [Tribonema minus]|uniref:Secreted protein n=1 Tax=Tribonema minus TaxID=303371 RepID=A0A835Z847_9STRA|nr:hypothetical protein JKP88DRAFT_235919 [Tribonema minus]
MLVPQRVALLYLLILATLHTCCDASSDSRRRQPAPSGRRMRQQSQHQHQEPTQFTKRAEGPCRFFLWNASSALQWCTCTRLYEQTRRDWLYEGRGGQRFLRVTANNPLRRLYPCERHSMNRCLLCGHSFREHIERHAISGGPRPIDAVLAHSSGGSGHNKGVLSGKEGASGARGVSIVQDPSEFLEHSKESSLGGGWRALVTAMGRCVLEAAE